MILLWIVVGVWAVLVLLRLAKRRIKRGLGRATLRSLLGLGCIGGIAWLLEQYAGDYWSVVLPVFQLVTASVFFVTTTKTLYKMKPRSVDTGYADRDLPTVTVAIPARNETDDLQECLRSILANDYPKLEVIVLDDCSQTPTADIIKGFAQDGVRFIPGVPPTDGWLAKNLAYETLYLHASGDIILFCGVDVRFEASTIRQIIYQMLERHKRMVSVMPVRVHGQLIHAIIQPMRYWWEVTVPRKLLGRPAALSTCWAIYVSDLKKRGGFKGLRQTINPEQFLARDAVAKDGYSFLRASQDLGLQTVKPARRQFHTALRTRYPNLRKRPENVLLYLLFVGGVLLLPFVLVLVGLFADVTLWPLYVLTCLLLLATHARIMQASDPGHAYSAVLLPISAIVEIIATLTSMMQYEFFTVTWRGRNICLPVMRVYPHLPNENDDGGESDRGTH